MATTRSGARESMASQENMRIAEMKIAGACTFSGPRVSERNVGMVRPGILAAFMVGRKYIGFRP